MDNSYIPATPYAKYLARERNIDISLAMPTGYYGAVRAADLNKLGSRQVKATPLAVRAAIDLGIGPETLEGSGWGGKVLYNDVLAAKGKVIPGFGERREKISGMRKAIAQGMIKAHSEIPPVTQTMRVDVTALVELRAGLKKEGKNFTINDFILLGTAKALRKNPQVLVSYDTGEIIYKDEVNLGMAVALEQGLIVPVLRNADMMSLEELSGISKDLAERARAGKLLPDEYKGQTFTVSNMGSFDIESFTPIINQPDAGILGICCIVDELALENGMVKQKKIMRTSLTFDHRLLDGVSAAKFQLEVKKILENPVGLLI